MDASLRDEISRREWYHTIELAPGVVTPGFFDLRPVAREVLPDSLAGKRCLDVATFDGFWAIEMADRGAVEVLAIDILDPRRWDWPAGSGASQIEAMGSRKDQGRGFEIVMEALGRTIARRELSVYDLDPAEMGTFDFVYVGSLLLHLRDPVRALERIRSVCGGELLLVDNIDPALTRMHPRRPVADFDGLGRPWWWKLNLAALERMVRSAGFEPVAPATRLKMRPGAGFPRPRLRPRTLRSHEGRVQLRNAWFGDPHAVIRARPRVP